MKPLEHARLWAEAGYYVFPCVPNGKTPLIKDGFKGASNKPEDVDDWLKVFPEANYGIACGASGLVVLDFDKKNGGLESLDTLVASRTINDNGTFSVYTPGGGFHIYYKGLASNRAGILPGFDVRGDGGYVVGEGSVVDGKPYKVFGEYEIADVTDPVKAAITRPAPTRTADITGGLRGSLNKRSLRFVAEGAMPGQWHQELFQAAMDCKQNGYSQVECEDLLRKATGVLDDKHDLPTINDVYTKRNPLYAPNIDEESATYFATCQKLSNSDSIQQIYVKASELLEESVAYCNNKDLTTGTATGIPSLDKMLGGGVRPGEVLGVLASAKVGKSSFTHKIIHDWLKRGLPVGYASRELRPATEVLPNLFSIELICNVLKTGVDAMQITEILGKWPLYFAPGLGAFPMDEIEGWMQALSEMGVRLFVFDHLIHFVNDEDYKAISMFSRHIKALSQRFNVASILVIQPKQLQMGERVSFNNIRGGSAVGQAIDSLIVLERERDNDGKLTNVTQVRLDIARHKLSRPGSIYLAYDSDTMDYAEVEQTEEPEGESEDTGPVFDKTKAGQGMLTKRLDS